MGWIGYDRAVGHKGTNSPRLYLVDWRRLIGLATIGWGGLATTGRFGYDVAGLATIGQVGRNWIARVGKGGMGWPRWGGLA